jgi:hypothetical protein
MKKIIKNIAATASESAAGGALDGKTQGVVSLSVPTPSAADKDHNDQPNDQTQFNVEEDFFHMLELEMKKVSSNVIAASIITNSFSSSYNYSAVL